MPADKRLLELAWRALESERGRVGQEIADLKKRRESGGSSRYYRREEPRLNKSVLLALSLLLGTHRRTSAIDAFVRSDRGRMPESCSLR